MQITENERKRLLHAYETLMFAVNQLPRDEQQLRAAAWMDILNILSLTDLKGDLHGGGEWLDRDIANNGHWECIK